MNPNQDISTEEWEQIERYLDNGLAPQEKDLFENRLAGDAVLQSKLTEISLLRLGIGEATLRQQLTGFHKALPGKDEKKGRIIRSSFKTWLVAASVLFLASLAGWLFFFSGSDSDHLFKAYFKPDPGLITAMSATDNYAFEQAMVEYKQGHYGTAIRTWDSLQKLSPASDTLNYFLGVAHLANEAPVLARPYLEKLTSASQSFFQQDAWWYLGLALLKEGKIDEARKALQKSAHPKKEEILKKLDGKSNH